MEIPIVHIETTTTEQDDGKNNDNKSHLSVHNTNKRPPKLASLVQKNRYATQDFSDSMPSSIDALPSDKYWRHKCQRQQSNSICSSNSDWLGRNEWRTDGQRRWSMATQKIKNLLAVSDTLNAKSKQRRIERTMSIEQKSIFLDKFSTRDRKISSAGLNPKKFYENNHHQNHATIECVSNISSTELKEADSDLKESKTNLSQSDFSDTIIQDNCTCVNILFEPYSTLIYVWTWILITAIHYNLWIIIFRIAFPLAQHRYTLIWFILDYTADFIYLIDILVSSRMSFLENGIYVNDAKRVMLRYLKSKQFAVDLLCLVPLDLLYLFMEIDPSLRLPRVIKFYKVFTGKRVLESMTNFPNLLRGVFWLHMMFLLMHFNSCFFFIISKYEGFGSNDWVYPRHEGVHKELVHRYMKCMYWSTLVLTTIGENHQPETTIECVYMIVCYITGIFIFATIVGQAGNVIQNMNASRMEFERQRDNTMQYMKDHNVPTHLQKRVRLWYDYTYSRGRFNGGDDINEATMLPDKMKTELALHVHLETLRKVSFLQKCQPEFLHDLVLKMKLHIFTPGDFIVRKGEIAREMYVISDGVAEVVSDSGHILKVLQPGDFFGEIGLLSLDAGQNRRTADVRSCGYIELFVLSKDDVMASIQDYPEAQKILARHGRKRLALGSKVSAGLRDETTSGSSQSDTDAEGSSEIRRRKDSNRSKYRERKNTLERERNSIEENDSRNNGRNSDKGTNRFNKRESKRISTLSLYTSPQKQPLLQNANSVRSMFHNSTNIIGPATSMKSLTFKYPPSRKCTTSSDDEKKQPSEMFLKPKRCNIRRSNSDMQKRPKLFFDVTRMKARSVCSDGERSDVNSSYPSLSIEKRNAIEKTTFQENGGTTDDTKDVFLESMKDLYTERIQAIKRKKNTKIRCLKNRVAELENRKTERDFVKEEFMRQQEDDFKNEIVEKCRIIDKLKDEISKKDAEFAEKEFSLNLKIERLENELKTATSQSGKNGLRKFRSSYVSTHTDKYELRDNEL